VRAEAVAAATARLTLENVDRTQAGPAAAAALDELRAGAVAAQAAASAAEQRVGALEQQLDSLRTEAAARQAALTQLRARLGESEEQRTLLFALLALVAVLAAVALWLGWRLRVLQRERQDGWRDHAAAQQAAAAAESVASDLDEPRLSRPLARVVPAGSWMAEVSAADAAALLASQAAASVLPNADADADADADASANLFAVSVDELIDLEQQVEFFVVLGQDESAAALLSAHLGGSGGASPLPYLKLLEIQRRRNEREAYERTSARFQRRFDTPAPDWRHDAAAVSTLLDHAEVLACLQSAWPTPRIAMAELETLLFRRNGSRVLELPAYRDVLVLYAVARDLLMQPPPVAGDVDLLLPMATVSDHRPAVAHAAAATQATRLDGVPGFTAAVDLDLGQSPADSLFGPLPPITATLRRVPG
jgi:hypothetical protein